MADAAPAPIARSAQGGAELDDHGRISSYALRIGRESAGAQSPKAFVTLRRSRRGGVHSSPVCARRLNPGSVPPAGTALRGPSAAKRLVTSTRPTQRLPLKCHSPEGGTGFMFEKSSQPGAPLRNRTVDLLLTMDRSAVLQPQVDWLTSVNTSTRWHSRAPDEPSRTPFATQSATHFDLGDEPSYEVVNIQFDDSAACVHGLSPRFTSANRLRSARRAVQGWTSNATQTVLARVAAVLPSRSRGSRTVRRLTRSYGQFGRRFRV